MRAAFPERGRDNRMSVGRGSNVGTGRRATSTAPLAEQGYQRDLGQGLRVRWSASTDTEQLVTMFANVLRDGQDAPPNYRHGLWVRDMMSGRCPHITAQD